MRRFETTGKAFPHIFKRSKILYHCQPFLNDPCMQTRLQLTSDPLISDGYTKDMGLAVDGKNLRVSDQARFSKSRHSRPRDDNSEQDGRRRSWRQWPLGAYRSVCPRCILRDHSTLGGVPTPQIHDEAQQNSTILSYVIRRRYRYT